MPAPGTRGLSDSASVWLTPAAPLSCSGVAVAWNRKGRFCASCRLFCVSVVALTLMVGALIRTISCAVGSVTLACVVPDEMKLPNCSATLEVELIEADWVARITGEVAVVFCDTVRPSVPPVMSKVEALTEPVALVLATNRVPLFSTVTATAPVLDRITLLT